LGIQVFHAILRDERFKGIPKILEIPERDTRSEDNLKLLRKLQKRIDPLPEEKHEQTQLILSFEKRR
jgi:deoxyribonuclease-4